MSIQENLKVSDPSATTVDKEGTTPTISPQQTRKGFQFWAILIVLAFASLLTALEATITSTVLPVLVADLGGSDNYIWIANAYLLTL
jgi:hypothetical protein